MEVLNAINIEQSVLGSFMVEEAIGYKLEDLKEDMFTVEYNKCIFNIMKELRKNKQTLDIQTIASKVAEKGYGINVSYLSNLVAMSASYAIETHIDILREKYIRRFIIKNCTTLFQNIGEGQDINLAIYKFENEMKMILEAEASDGGDSIGEICEKLYNFLENKESLGIKFGVEYLDEMIGGLFQGELTTIAARSGVGKTALALQIMINCMEQGKKVLFISREMTNMQVFMRNITKKTGVSVKNMKTKNLDEESWKKIIKAMEHFSKDNLIYISN
ncbi:MAG: DnaB-like helicase C-terminal domain-containing protein [Fusobacteriaceae bacterium]